MRVPAVMASPVFRYYFSAQTVSAFGSAMSWLAVTFAILRIGGSAADLGGPVLVAALLGQVVVRVLLMASPSIRSVRRIEPAAAEAVTRAG